MQAPPTNPQCLRRARVHVGCVGALFNSLKCKHTSAANMGGRALIRCNADAFLSSLAEFCADSASTCFSAGADKLCVPVGLVCLSALLLLLSCCLLVYQRCRVRREGPDETVTCLYCLLGSLCSTGGAFLSRQLHILILLGAVSAATDAVHSISSCFLLLQCYNSEAERRLRMRRRRRRQRQLLAVCVLMVVAGGFLKSRVTQLPADRPPSGRRLLHEILEDNTEILGYTLGLLSFVISCTSRFPALRRAHRGQTLTLAATSSGLLCSLAGALFAAAILLYDTRFEFLLGVMPWLLSAICCVTLDLLILVIHWWRRGTRQQLTTLPPDTESLLRASRMPTEDKAVMKSLSKQKVHSSAQSKNIQKATEMGRYMDVSIQPARKEEMGDQLLTGKVRVIRVNSFYSSDTSCDSSAVSSDLEWDFEETNIRWCEPAAKQPFPPQGWPTKPKPFNFCICAMSGLSEKTVSGAEECGSVSSAGRAK
ncbi:transmembrane protein 44 isoform X1 [Acanthopagrus latus]|uniref:transmembrane protein 44 isoform X1 n=1 Tax=Acanthopagrus latus TaxID=8177 RepID=UPI00187C263E|nr:transmembrane protein 44 isoform X1 [Acanthopagrus latus]